MPIEVFTWFDFDRSLSQVFDHVIENCIYRVFQLPQVNLIAHCSPLTAVHDPNLVFKLTSGMRPSSNSLTT